MAIVDAVLAMGAKLWGSNRAGFTSRPTFTLNPKILNRLQPSFCRPTGTLENLMKSWMRFPPQWLSPCPP